MREEVSHRKRKWVTEERNKVHVPIHVPIHVSIHVSIFNTYTNFIFHFWKCFVKIGWRPCHHSMKEHCLSKVWTEHCPKDNRTRWLTLMAVIRRKCVSTVYNQWHSTNNDALLMAVGSDQINWVVITITIQCNYRGLIKLFL